MHNGTRVVVKEIDTSVRRELVYNFTVANTHNYFVGEDGVLVHNTITPVNSGTHTSPKVATPDSIYIQKTEGGEVKSISYYDETGKRFSREDYIQSSKHWVTTSCGRYNLKNHPHDHQTRVIQRPNGPYFKKQVRILDKNGKPITEWVNEGPG